MADDIFTRLESIILEQQAAIQSISEKLKQLEFNGGEGNATMLDYEPNKLYTRNTLLVDTETETVYRVLHEYTSVTVGDDTENGHLKLVGFEHNIVTFSKPPTQEQIDALPDDTLVAVYSATDSPYKPQQTS